MRAFLAVMALAVLLHPLVSTAQVPAAQEGRERMRDRFNQQGGRSTAQAQAKFDEALRKFQDEDPPTKLEGIAALGTVGADDRPKAIGYLLQSANDPDTSFRIKSIDTLGNMQARQAVSPLVQQLFMRDTDRNTKQHILVALGKIGDPRATKPILDFLARGGDVAVRGNAIYALGEIGDKAALPPLEALEKNGDDDTLRALARTSAQRIREKPAPEVLPPALASDQRRTAPPEDETQNY
jgi:HEAT repeat protein